ncbi:MAG: hypothetical protein QOH89_3077 [Pseudonocardiales bacterium]|nr:hypothetical protein [Pseudonocardiales bacterium]
MRVLFSTTAGAGHFAPIVPFARAVSDAGHDVRVAAAESFASTVQRAGFEHAPFDDADPAEIGAVYAQLHRVTVDEGNTRVAREIFARIDSAAALPKLRAIVDSWRPDVVIGETAEFSSALVAQERGLPQLRVNIALDAFTEQMYELVDEPLRELGCATGSEDLRAVPRLTLLPSAFDAQAGSAAVHRFRDASVASADHDIPSSWWPERYADRPLVYVTFGSIAGGTGFYPGFYRRVLDMLADVPARVLMTLGAGLDPAALGELAPNVHVENWWPQESVLGAASVVVGHGGFGTTIATLAHGVPQVIVPLFAGDQYANADRVGAVGVGISLSPGDPVSLRSADVIPAGPDLTSLAEAVSRALTDRALAATARSVAAELANLPSAAEAVDVILAQTSR